MNKTSTLLLFFVYCILIPAGTNYAQGQNEFSAEKIEDFKAEVKNLVNFLEYSFNTLGNPKTSARDKDVIINESYAKIFLNAEVQVEDDIAQCLHVEMIVL